MLFKYCNLTFFNCVLCLGESLTFFPSLLFKLPNDRRRFKALFMGGKNCERISEKYLRFLAIFKLIYDFNIFLCLCNDWVNCFVFNLEISLEMGGSEWRGVTLKGRKMYSHLSNNNPMINLISHYYKACHAFIFIILSIRLENRGNYLYQNHFINLENGKNVENILLQM